MLKELSIKYFVPQKQTGEHTFSGAKGAVSHYQFQKMEIQALGTNFRQLILD